MKGISYKLPRDIAENRLYVVPGADHNGNYPTTHLAYLSGYSFSSAVVCRICFRNNPIMLAWSCESAKEGDVFPADREWAEEWDKLLHEVNCPTCLKYARGA